LTTFRTSVLDSLPHGEYVNVYNIYMVSAMTAIAARLDDFGRPAWIALMIAGFVLCWPVGLIILGYLIGSGRMSCWTPQAGERWQDRMDRLQRRMQDKMGSMQQRMQRHGGWCGPRAWTASAAGPSSGNRAFDEYREETLRRLEDEQRQFKDFLDRLRHAKDKAEFDQFMAERHSEGSAPQSEI
jgi:Protein of unknown function (DUF2852)